jgi:3-oxoacyl-[acyl-carrier-protein] synthase I
VNKEIPLGGDVAVIGVGAVTPSGPNALVTAMALRAGKCLLRQSRFIDAAGENIGICTLPYIADDLTGRERYVDLAAPALASALAPLGPDAASKPVPLLLALPEGADPLDPRGARLLEALATRAGVRLDLSRSKVFAQGRAAGISAFEAAIARLRDGTDAMVLVGGVDSYFDAERLEALDGARRLHGPETENGLIPGEAAAFVLLVSAKRAGSFHRYASIAGVGVEREPLPFGSPEPSQYLGMTVAMKRALESARGIKFGWTISDVAFERHRIDEWLHVTGRLHASFAEGALHEQPLALTGDVGAASVPLFVTLACVAWQVGTAPALIVAIAAHADGAERGVMTLGFAGSAA